MKAPRNRVLDYAVYLLVRGVVATCQAIPIGVCYRLADGLAWLAYQIDRRHRQVALENLRHAFGDAWTDAERDRVVRAVYRHFLRMVMEMLHIPRALHLETWRDHVELGGQGPILDRFLDGGPMILVTGHFGNWEMMGYLFGLYGFPSSTIYRPLDNPYLDRYIKEFRGATGQQLIPKKGGSEQMVAVLEGGGLLSALADQDAGAKGLFVDFFGRPASTFKALALMAIQYQAPIAVGGARRIGPGFRYEIHCEELIEPAEWACVPDPVRWITQRYTSALERLIRRSPEQYLWLHRRWKHQLQPRGRAAKLRASQAEPTSAAHGSERLSVSAGLEPRTPS
jgi:KDO2-lipid IV(A) lauroyltransferase